MYTMLHIFRQVFLGAGNQGNHQNLKKKILEPSLPVLLDFPVVAKLALLLLSILIIMAIQVVEFSNREYKIRNIFA